MKTHKLRSPVEGDWEITIHVDGDGGSITTSGLHETGDSEEDETLDQYNAAIDGVESLLLALACAGVNVGTSQYADAVLAAVNAIGDNFS